MAEFSWAILSAKSCTGTSTCDGRTLPVGHAVPVQELTAAGLQTKHHQPSVDMAAPTAEPDADCVQAKRLAFPTAEPQLAARHPTCLVSSGDFCSSSKNLGNLRRLSSPRMAREICTMELRMASAALEGHQHRATSIICPPARRLTRSVLQRGWRQQHWAASALCYLPVWLKEMCIAAVAREGCGKRGGCPAGDPCLPAYHSEQPTEAAATHLGRKEEAQSAKQNPTNNKA